MLTVLALVGSCFQEQLCQWHVLHLLFEISTLVAERGMSRIMHIIYLCSCRWTLMSTARCFVRRLFPWCSWVTMNYFHCFNYLVVLFLLLLIMDLWVCDFITDYTD
jgi:hypothetical protein